MVISLFCQSAARLSVRQIIKVKLNVIIKSQYCLLCNAKASAIEEGSGDKPVADLGYLSDKCSG
jgi:hypothetical protein